jgi:hypothetical protein
VGRQLRGTTLVEAETLVTICEDLNRFPNMEARRLRGLMDEISRMLTVMRRNRRGTLERRK